MTVGDAQDRMDSVEFESWKIWLGFYDPSGIRTPEDELADLIAARALFAKAPKGSALRDLRLFPPPMSQEEKLAEARAKLTGYLGAVKGTQHGKRGKPRSNSHN